MARAETGGPRRRIAAGALVAAGGALVAAAVAALVLALAGGDDPSQPAAPRAAPGTVALADARFGVALRHPRGWRRDADRRAIRLTSPDRRIGISITSVAPRPAVAQVRGAVERLVARTFAGGRVLRRTRGRVGGRPARLAAIQGRNSRGERLDVLLATVASRWRTYAVVTFGSPAASQELLRQAEAVLASLRFTRPG